MITKSVAERLSYLCELVPDKIKAFDKADLVTKPSPEKWSKQEILGHLIDSAANNHQRFIRVQFEEAPTIFYDQDNWVKHNHYNELDIAGLVALWAAYNKHLATLIAKIPEENLEKECRMRDGRLVTLKWLITDYVQHMEHHLRQIFGGEFGV